MKNKKQNEELQNRREFFKNAAKKALPIIGAIALASNPIIAKVAEEDPMGCNGYCSSGCGYGCSYGCSGSCSRACTGCSGGCTASCGGCRGMCMSSCSGWSR